MNKLTKIAEKSPIYQQQSSWSAKPKLHFNTDDHSLSQGLFRFSEGAKFLTDSIAKKRANDKKAKKLHKAIIKGHAHDPIWSDEDCQVTLLHLITKDTQYKIPHALGMTAYTYLMALMQYTEKQQLKSIDNDTKELMDIHIDVLAKDNKLTKEGEKFIESTHTRLKAFGIVICKTELGKFILALPPIEQWLIKMPVFNSHIHTKLHHRDVFFHRIVGNVPFFVCEFLPTGIRGDCWIPSTSVFNYILQQVSPNPVKLISVFGTIDVPTLLVMHEQNTHPGMLYSKYLDNPEKAGSYRCGPFVMRVHDFGHAFWGSLLSETERHFIFEHFIPKMQSLLNTAKRYQDIQLIKKIESIIEDAGDFDLTDIRTFTSSNRLIPYLSRTFSNNRGVGFYPDSRFEFSQMGHITEDRLYFLLWRMFHEMFAGMQNDIWEKICLSLKPENSFLRAFNIINSIEKCAEYAVKHTVIKSNNFVMLEEDYEAWIAIIDPSKSSEEVWKEIFYLHREIQFYYLTLHGQLLFFHPYLPLSDEMRNTFRNALQTKLDELKKASFDGEFQAKKSALQANHLLAQLTETGVQKNQLLVEDTVKNCLLMR